MSILQAALLGFVQGLCEFLPVSSSGHLILLQRIFGVSENSVFFTVMLHLATLIAVLIVYRRTVWRLIRRPFQKTVLYLILATVPTVIVALAFKKVPPLVPFYEAAERGEYLGCCFLLTACLLAASDLILRPRKKQRTLKTMRATDALAVGAMQGIGVLPGVSRSGSTIAGALFAGLDRRAAADFSFLLSIPAIVGGAVLEIPEALREGAGSIDWVCVLVGMAVAGITGYLAIRLVLTAIKKRGLWGFAVYVGLLGTAILVDQFVTHLVF